jgi:hypothetical protein
MNNGSGNYEPAKKTHNRIPSFSGDNLLYYKHLFTISNVYSIRGYHH